MNSAQRLQEQRGQLLIEEPMSRHTSWRVGGVAENFYIPADIDDLVLFLEQLPTDENLFWFGLGSNLLVRDGGIKGTVICMTGVLNTIKKIDELRVEAGAGASCAKFARFCVQSGLTGAEFLAGIPGTVGGALTMNAGAFGGEIWPLVEQVEVINRFGRRVWRSRDEYRYSYRHVDGPENEWFVSVRLKLKAGDGVAAMSRIKKLLEQRNAAQPIGLPSCGSVFRNPENDHAGRLIEVCGLKGYSLGGAMVSEKHANFIINKGDATASDIESLMNLIVVTVEKQCGVRLKTEVHIVGVAS
ncbi:MAG TPA: UDP-N-acetylmuramate dehydrogenase [Gammaproteobacteria bacterium]|nr:UDP-N-acetylmuramate dehydrogenase [Gammaproteobacteria bacterium]